MPEPVVVTPVAEVQKVVTPVVEPTKVEPTLLTPAVTPVEPVKAVEPVAVAAPVKPAPVKITELKLSENSSLTAAEVEKLTAQANEQGFSVTQAQELVKASESSISSYVKREIEKTKSQAPVWLEQLKSDKEYGGEKFNESVENAKRVVEKYAEPEFKNFLNDSGLGNHPLIVKMFSKLGKAFGEDHFKDGTPIVTKKTVSPAERMYDKTPAK